MSDYHLHLHPHSPTDEGPPPGVYPDGHVEAFVEVAAGRGVDELGFTEHLYRCEEAAAVLGEFWREDGDAWYVPSTVKNYDADRNLSLDAYVSAVVDAKDDGLPVKLGLEIDFFPESIGAVLDLLEPYPWDFLIGSVHWIGGWGVDDGRQFDEFDRRGVDQAWDDYFSLERQLAASGAVDVLAHVDVVKKLGTVPSVDPEPWYAEVVTAAAASGTAVEVSSQGLRYECGEVYPAPRFLQMFHDAGVPITLASDGHRPSEAGLDHEAVVDAARAAGYTTHRRFDQRRAHDVELPTPAIRS